MPMRINGMSSGMDIDLMVKDLMKAERMPLVKKGQKKDLLQFRMDLYREVSSKLYSLRESVSSMRYSANLSSFKLNSSNESIVKVSGAGQNAMNSTIKVNKLAQSATTSSQGTVSNTGLQGSAVGGNVTVSAGANDEFIIDYNGSRKKIKLEAKSYTPDELGKELQKKIDSEIGVNKVEVSMNGSAINIKPLTSAQVKLVDVNALSSLGFQNNQSYKLNLETSLLENKGKFLNGLNVTSGGNYEISINGVSIQYSADDSVQQIMNKINGSKAGVNISYDSAADRFSMTTKDMGSNAKIKLEDKSGNLLSSMGFDLSKVAEGVDAEVEINGITSTRDSNTFTQDGVTYTLLQESPNSVTVTNTADVSGVVDKVKKFVSAYNEAVGLINKMTGENKLRGYDPLTSEQKKELSEDEVKNWEKKTKQGLLKNDSLLEPFMSGIRTMLSKSYAVSNSDYDALFKIGFGTTKYEGNKAKFMEDSGKIVLDEEKLTKALQESPEAVTELLTKSSTKTEDAGFLHQLYSKLNDTITSINKKSGKLGGSYLDASTELGKKYSDMELDYKSLEMKLTKKEDDYYKKFAAMEKALAYNNSQLNFLMQNMK
ncbi:flagellar filament capping protein FliD [Paenibacillus sp. MER 180]|uniref:flagellar filament capping protein FliD n=1 Tax=Paenibacillus sp. MER 180 TaxID=2939570 RepID=UPI00203F6CB9|nr:flagellar filament capping protein FliD [Paenibacillus sp. MER 180]MCM3288565.1 flagellar filament capping protein FliD [Paenibacillus sp. MER 180]